MNLSANIKSRLIRTVAGVSVHFTKADEYTISFVVLKVTKGKTQILESKSGLKSVDELPDHIDSNTPIWLSVTGRPVISRKLNTDPGGKYLNHVLPNAKETDFLVSSFKTTKEEVFVSAIRNEQIEILRKIFHECNYNLHGISIGPASLALLPGLELLLTKQIEIPGYILTLEKGVLTELSVIDKSPIVEYKLGSDVVSSQNILAFATALSYLLYHRGTDTLVSESLATDEESFVFRILNRYLVFGSLGIVFFLLLVNFLAFSFYNRKQQVLSGEISYREGMFVQRDSLRKEIALKTDLIKQMGLSEDTRYGFFIDRIAATVPEGINLTFLTLNPLADKIKPGKPVQFKKHFIIKGESNGSLPLNEWIDALNSYEWIDDIEIVRYEKSDNKGEFEITILY